MTPEQHRYIERAESDRERLTVDAPPWVGVALIVGVIFWISIFWSVLT